MDEGALRKSDFKTGSLLIVFCLWFLSVTFLFMPFRETYGGVENVWYVSPWIFPAIVLTLLLVLSVILTINAIRQNGMGDVAVFPEGRISRFRLTRLGFALLVGLAIALAVGLAYLVIGIGNKIDHSLEEAKWLADPSTAHIFQWTDPAAVISLTGLSLALAATLSVLAVAAVRNRAVKRNVATARAGMSEPTSRFFIIALLFVALIYVFVPNVDFFVSILLFLSVFTAVFHVGGAKLVRFAMGTYLATATLTAIVFLTGFDTILNAGYRYTTDLLVLAATLAHMVRIWLSLDDEPARRRYRTCLVVSWLTPLVLVPSFRFGLLVPLPVEGGVVELMHQIRYAIR